MRAATAIVAAIAISSVLIALAFVLSGSDGSNETAQTRTVTEFKEAPPTEGEQPSGEEAGAQPSGGPAGCGNGEFTVENVSCEIGESIHRQYEEGARGQFFAQDPNESITMTCEVSTPVICTGPGGAAVYFAP